jgi:hypothetical protein
MNVSIESLSESQGSAMELVEEEFKTVRESTVNQSSNLILLADRNPDGGSRELGVAFTKGSF